MGREGTSLFLRGHGGHRGPALSLPLHLRSSWDNGARSGQPSPSPAPGPFLWAPGVLGHG